MAKNETEQKIKKNNTQKTQHRKLKTNMNPTQNGSDLR